ncbi:hypothetical protein [Neobacillus notoginsengisoli]|nr:hypothetical protein [Neobacillus notoginsengisoli]
MLRAFSINEDYVEIITENGLVRSYVFMISKNKYFEHNGGVYKVADLA